jgi:hypothetical protein
LPENGGVPDDSKQIVESNGGKVWTAITDQNGKFKIGDFFEVDQRTGFINFSAGSYAFDVVTDTTPELGGQLDALTNKIVNLGTPTAGTDAATKAYVDTNAGISTGTANTFTAEQTFNAGVSIDGAYEQAAEAVAALDIDLSTGNYFTKTINANSTFTFSNPPASGTVGSFTLELTHTSGTVTWPASVKFNADTAPTLTTGKTHLFFFVTDDGGTRYRGAALVDYVN